MIILTNDSNRWRAGGATDALASPSSSRGARSSARPAAPPPRLVRTAGGPQCPFSLNDGGSCHMSLQPAVA